MEISTAIQILARVPQFTAVQKVLKEIEKNNNWVKSHDISYLNTPIAFDIETASFLNERGEKTAITYMWTFAIEDTTIQFRSWEWFDAFMTYLSDFFHTHIKKRIIIYVHNLAYEFQFMRKWLNWENVFAIDSRKPVYALTDNGVEFRCSYILSGYSLEKVAENLQKHPIKKLVGDLDYNLVRNSETVLTPAENAYCINDVLIITHYIKECIENDGNIAKIPLTKTGYVRDFCRNACLYPLGKNHKKGSKEYCEFRAMIKNLNITTEEYNQLKRAFQGGFTHASAWKNGKIYENVGSYDFTSSYPAVMLAERFPMSSAEKIEIKSEDDFNFNLRYYCCLFDVFFDNLESISYTEHPLSVAKCRELKNYINDNGRLVCAKTCLTTMTEQDFFTIREFYKWDSIKVGNFRRYKKGYLPTEFVKAILKLYENKTVLKGVAGKEIEYLKSKEMLNSCYGMTVTDVCREEIIYKTEWSEESPNVAKSLEKYNKNPRRFLFYPWGVWVTAYARRNLFSGIKEFANDYIYSDTDSIKATNIDRHNDYINRYNMEITKKLQQAMEWHGLPIEKTEPKTKDGVKKPLGVWDFEGTYTYFKTIGAKRYITYKDNKLSLTVAGLNKKVCAPYLIERFGNVLSVFKNFNDSLYIPPEHTGKNTHTYIDEEQTGHVTDYQGNTAEYIEKSCVHLTGADYSFSLSSDYIKYLLSIQTDEI